MNYEIKKDFLEGLPEINYRTGKGKYEGVVNHSTATPEATDETEMKYFHREWKNRKAFPHFFVDWDSITKCASTEYKAWAAGNGNPRYVHVELCETKDPVKFKESYKRYVWLVAKLLKDRNLGVADGITLVSHDWVSKNLGGTDHTDPIGYLKSHGISWTQHVANVKAEYDFQMTPSTRPTPKTPKHIGVVTVKADTLNVRDKADIKGKIVGKLHEGEQYKAYDLVKGWYNVGAGWVSGKYVSFKAVK